MDSFYALAEPHRRKVVEILARRGKLNATQICSEFEVTPQAMSQHLRVLREAKLIRLERKAQMRFYTINPESMFEIGRWAAGVAEMWNSRLARLDRALEEAGSSETGGEEH